MEEIDLPMTLPGARHALHLFTIWVDRRDAFLERLQDQGIGVAVNYRPVHLLTYYRRRFGFRERMFPNAEHIGRRTLSLPLYPCLTDEQVTEVIRAAPQAAAKADTSMPMLPSIA